MAKTQKLLLRKVSVHRRKKKNASGQRPQNRPDETVESF